MMKYARIVDKDTRRCEVGIGTDDEFYISIGMELMDVEEAYDGNWYVSGYVPEPVYTPDDYDKALLEHIASARVARGYTLRLPTLFLSSTIPRWKQDAVDFVAFRDNCLAYGLDVRNAYARTGMAPTLDEFIHTLETDYPCKWSYSDIVTHADVVLFLYTEKCRVAYGGVTLITDSGSYVFLTSIDSATMCSCQLHALLEQADDYIVYWKVWTHGAPQIIGLTKPQFKQVFAFSRDMINQAFGLLGNLNQQAAEFTLEELQDVGFMNTFYTAAIDAFNALNTSFQL